jgi:hypothetical protein
MNVEWLQHQLDGGTTVWRWSHLSGELAGIEIAVNCQENVR